MRSPRPGFLLRLAARLLLCLTAGSPALAQNFAQPAVIKTGNWPAAIYAADVNGDGYPDLIYIDQGATPGRPSTTHILLNDGHGNFTASASLATVGTSLAVADMDGNGTADLVWVITSPPPPGSALYSIGSFTAVVAFGNGDGTFAAPTPYGTPISLTPSNPPLSTFVLDHVAVGHFYQKTGALDIVAEETSQNILCKFAGSSNLSQGAYLPGPGPIHVADLNKDGYDDLVLQQSDTNILTLLGGPNFKYSAVPDSFAGLTGIRSVIVRDVNLDGVPDLIAEGANGRIDVFPGNGDGTFQTTSAGGTGTLNGLTGNGGHLIAIADLNHDGQLDALAATPVGVSALLGQGTQYFGLKGIYNAGPGHTSYVMADFNGDGNLDLAIDSPEGIAILYGQADGSFQTSQAFAAGQPAMSGTVGAFTSSGNVDAVVSTAATQAQFLQGNGDGTFSYAGSPGTPTPTTAQTGAVGVWSTIQAGDFNGDGALDLLITGDASYAALPTTGAATAGAIVQFGTGNGDFGAPSAISFAPLVACPQAPEQLYGWSVTGDFNGDGITDFANRDSHLERTFLGVRGSSSFPSQVYESVDTNCNLHAHDRSVAGDLNGDGFLDLVEQTDGHLEVQLNGGAGGGFGPIGDLSVDGSLTLSGQVTAPALNSTFNGPAVPPSSGGLGFPAFPGAMTIADLDRDGNNDLIVTYANLSANLQAPSASAPNYIYIWYGSGGGKFLTSAKHPVNPVRLTPSRNFYQVAIADMNGDGVPDLILSDGYLISIQLGKGDGSFGAETHYLGGQGINTISVADVNHDGKPDLVLANGGAVLTNPVANLEVLATNPDVNTGGITVLLNQAPPAGLVSMGTVTASPEPTTYGEAFSLTATVSSPLSGTAPTGTVAFSIDGNAIGSANVAGASATIYPPQSVYSTLAVGTHTLTAVYSGDGIYAQATFSGTHAVALIPTSIGLALCVDPPGSIFPCGVNFPNVAPPLISPITMYFGQSIDGLATESASDLTGDIIFYNGTAVFCTLNANLQQGGMTCPTASGFFPVGDTIVTVDYTGDSTHAASMSNGVQVIVSPDVVTATVTSSLNPSLLGQSVMFTANVQGNYAVATGSVTFLDGATVLGMATLDATGHATLATANLALGDHPITVSYAANANFNAAVSPVLTQMVATVVTGSVVIAPEPSVVGNAFTMTATVVPPPPSATTIPTGTVAFSIDGALVGPATLVNGVATLAGPSTLAVGTHTVSAVYSSDANYLTATFVHGHAVILSPTTTTLLPSGATTIYYGQPANSTYSVYGQSATHPPTGFFTVQDNGVSISYCTAIPLNSSCPYADGGANKLTVGTHSLVVLYLGDSYNAPSASLPVVFTVLPDITSATLTSSDNPAIAGTSVTFTAKIAGNDATPFGTVSFMDGATTLGPATLDGNGGATFTTSGLALGTHPITVVYGGNADFNAVTSAVLNQLITDGPTTFTLTVTPTPVTVEIGHDAVLQVTVKATGGFSEPVQLSCPFVPEEATCVFAETLIPAGGGVTTLYFSPRAPGACGSDTPYSAGSPLRTTAGVVLACLAMLPLYRRRRLLTRTILISVATLCGLATLSGCGQCTDLGTRPGDYTFTVMGTAQGSTPLTASQTSQVTVTTVP